MMSGADAYDCGCVLLAAGGSRRLGRPKQLLRCDGESLITRAARQAIDAGFAPVIVVIGCQAEVMRSELAGLPLSIVENQTWATGMAGSLHAGIVQALAEHPAMGHVVIMLCDQVAVSVEMLEQLRKASVQRRDRLVASAYGNTLGVPAIFPSAFFPRLLALEGDRGARLVIEEYRDEATGVPFPQGDLDIDTIDDAQRAGLESASVNVQRKS